jgi:ribonucleotide monophosphatase NagD (HAD superfamily)
MYSRQKTEEVMIIMDFGFTSVAAITVICYLVATAIKATSLDKKWLPVICMACGGILGIFGIRYIPDYPATDILTAIAVGLVSGLAATGVHQTVKQLSYKNNNSNGAKK